jgi:hypothetical protein
MACNCINEFDAKLADYNTKLGLTIGWRKDGTTFTLPTIETEKVEKRVRKGPAIAIATFCPFCGVRYEPEPAAPKLEGGAA